jgi:hypothetical protein
VEAAGLLGQIGVDIAAEARELAGVLGRQQRVPVVGEANEGVHVHFV